MLTLDTIMKIIKHDSQRGHVDYRNAMCPHYIDPSLPNYHPEFEKKKKS